MTDAFGTELKVGQTVVVSRGRRGYLTKGIIYKIKSVQELTLIWEGGGGNARQVETMVEHVRVYWKSTPDLAKTTYTSFGGYIQKPGKVVVVG